MQRMGFILLLLPTVILSGFGVATAQDAAQPTPAPACSASEHRQFDFWIGEWSVTFTQDGRPAGHSVVESLYGGCALRENWQGRGGYSGGSLNAYSEGRWRQTWIGSDGAMTHYVGGIEGGAMVLLAHGEENGSPYMLRMTFTPASDGSVRQYIERSNDDGSTWGAEYDLTYRR